MVLFRFHLPALLAILSLFLPFALAQSRQTVVAFHARDGKTHHARFRKGGQGALNKRLNFSFDDRSGQIIGERNFDAIVRRDKGGPQVTVKCRIDGALRPGATVPIFWFSDERKYLSRCGAGKDGFTITCGGPGADCNGRWELRPPPFNQAPWPYTD